MDIVKDPQDTTVLQEIPQDISEAITTTTLPEEKKQQIATQLGAFFKRATDWEKMIDAIIIEDHAQVDKMEIAKRLRLNLKDCRIELRDLIKLKRDEVQARMANDTMEDKLLLKAFQMAEIVFKNLETKAEEKENFGARYLATERENLRLTREAECKPYEEYMPSGLNLGNMSEEYYLKTLKGARLQLEDKIRQDELREAQEKKDKEEKEDAARAEKQKHEDDIALKQKQNELASQRMETLKPVYNWADSDMLNLGTMDEDAFQKVLTDATNYKKLYDDTKAKIQKSAELGKARQKQALEYVTFWGANVTYVWQAMSEKDFKATMKSFREAKATRDIKVEGFIKVLKEKGYTANDGNGLAYTKGGYAVTTTKLAELNEKEFNERVLEVEQLIAHKAQSSGTNTDPKGSYPGSFDATGATDQQLLDAFADFVGGLKLPNVTGKKAIERMEAVQHRIRSLAVFIRTGN